MNDNIFHTQRKAVYWKKEMELMLEQLKKSK